MQPALHYSLNHATERVISALLGLSVSITLTSAVKTTNFDSRRVNYTYQVLTARKYFCSVLFPYKGWRPITHSNAEACSQLAQCVSPAERKEVYLVN